MTLKLWCVAQKVKQFVSEPLIWRAFQPCRAHMPQRKYLNGGKLRRSNPRMVLWRIVVVAVALALSMSGYATTHALGHVADPVTIDQVVHADCHGHAGPSDQAPAPSKAPAPNVCSDLCCLVMTILPVAPEPDGSPRIVRVAFAITAETLRRAPPAPPPRT